MVSVAVLVPSTSRALASRSPSRRNAVLCMAPSLPERPQVGRPSLGIRLPVLATLAQPTTHKWLPAIETTIRASTFESYGRYLRLHVIPAIGGVQLKDLDAARLNRLYATLRKEGGRRDTRDGGLSPRTVRYVHTIIHRALRDAVTWGRLARNVADAADPPSAEMAAEAAPEMTTWTGAELARFLDSTDGDRYHPAWTFLATTGMRRGEALGLTWDDMDLDTGKASIRRAITAIDHRIERGTTKSGKSRVIELDARTVAALRSHRARQSAEKLLLGAGYRDEGLIFCLPDGRPYHPERFSREFDRKQAAYNRTHLAPSHSPPAAPAPRPAPHLGHPGAHRGSPPEGGGRAARSCQYQHHPQRLQPRHGRDADRCRRAGGSLNLRGLGFGLLVGGPSGVQLQRVLFRLAQLLAHLVCPFG